MVALIAEASGLDLRKFAKARGLVVFLDTSVKGN
jgi:hypothetical protein